MSVFAISDLHGRFDLYQEVKKFLNPEDKVFFLGDAGDRGPDGWTLIKTIFEDEQFKYIMGNHEHMLIAAIQEHLDIAHPIRHCYKDPTFVLAYNGGMSTFDGWVNETPEDQTMWLNRLIHLPYKHEIINRDGLLISLTHAGYTPSDNGFLPCKYELIWDRSHMVDSWPMNEDNTIIVHGHTPMPTKVFTYADGHKIDIDVATVQNGITCLLDLDTFDEHYFKIERR